ncbi:hypothetical protein DKX38_029409 [Salix brachista]|uniref:hydroxyacylglutathione hydrolase n=1 Tax=Salix brachista TaxID=2182728 RepID=A0A5N5IZN1_9ROSI|nr:hypothetical protein DKX38_029409 [Salix brachista]
MAICHVSGDWGQQVIVLTLRNEDTSRSLLRRQLLLPVKSLMRVLKKQRVVDPVEPEKLINAANEHGLNLKFVLTTHHHWDHAGGNEKIKEMVPGIKVYGGSLDNVKGCTNKVENGDKVSLCADVTILALHTPCHTKGHISYYVTGKEGEDPAVFTGDTLRAMKLLSVSCKYTLMCSLLLAVGNFLRHSRADVSVTLCNIGFIAKACSSLLWPRGKDIFFFFQFFFSVLLNWLKFSKLLWMRSWGWMHYLYGCSQLIWTSIVHSGVSFPTFDVLRHLVLCPQYTGKNLQFALTVEPDNVRVQEKLSWAQNQRKAGLPTIPSTIDEEMEMNPFMRADLPDVQAKAGCHSPVEALRKIRLMKDNWRG